VYIPLVSIRRFTFLGFWLATLAPSAPAQSPDARLYSEMHWRTIGPPRAGRARALAGVPSQPNVFYIGFDNGGVWRSTDFGANWEPIFDKESTGSIGAIAVAPSNADVVYVGSGEADMRSDISHGDGMYKSIDGGIHWTHIGLPDTRQIGQVIVDPHDASVVFVAALGHGYGPNKERGVYRTKDGGASWTQVLFKNEDTGAIDLAFDPSNSKTILAAMWQTRRPPWNVYPPSNGPGSGLYRSEDGGDTWNPVTSGLPSEKVGRIRIAFAPSSPRRVYVLVDAKAGGLFVSNDGGVTFALASSDKRIWERGWYFAGVTVDPAGEVEALHEYDAWTQLRDSPQGIEVGDLLETDNGELRICKYVGFEPAQWILPEPKPESKLPPPLEAGSASPSAVSG
jgi:photosystem II stability/assembly factor-like uncharacterized protein